jgi:hypothetical protein
VNTATLPVLADVWNVLPYESFPIGYLLATRVWATVGDDSTLHLRRLGLITGVLLLAALWGAGRLLGGGVPLLSLSLLAFNLTAIRWGDSLRAYGLGSALVVLALALVWQFTRKPSLKSGLLAAGVALLSVQTLYQNGFLILAVCVAGCAMSLRRKQARRAAWTLAIGAPAAVSLLPYLDPLARAQDWWMVLKMGFEPELALENFSEALGVPAVLTNSVWLLSFLVALAHAGAQFKRSTARAAARGHGSNVSSRNAADPDGRDLALFAAAAMLLGVAGFLLFLELASLPTQPWQYIPIVVFMGVCLDAIWRTMPLGRQIAVAALAVGGAVAAYPSTLAAMSWRITNIDLVAAHLTEASKPTDLVIVHPWYAGISFQRYYSGMAPWTTLPPLEDHRIHRYDLLKAQMQRDNPIQPVLDQVRLVLEVGGRVWLVGSVPAPDAPPPSLEPAPSSPWGWRDDPYSHVWGAQLGHFLKTHAESATLVIDPAKSGVNEFENLPLISVTGWKRDAMGFPFSP